jgi:transcriptional regulator with XRE-family HTH domain
MNQKIKFLRETLGLTEKEISSFLNISSYKYASFEKAMTIIPCDILILLSRIYGINIKLLIDSKFSNQDLLFELESQGIIGEKNTLEKLKQNLLQDNIKLTYRSVKKIKINYQDNIIYFLKALIYDSGKSVIEFSKYVNINSQNLDSILQKKRFIELNELISISEKFRISVNDIIGV